MEEPAVHDVQIPHDGEKRRRAAGGNGAVQRTGRPGVQDEKRPKNYKSRTFPAPHQPGRAAAVIQCIKGRHVAGGAEAAAHL